MVDPDQSLHKRSCQSANRCVLTRCCLFALCVVLPLHTAVVDVGGLVQPDLSGATPCVDDATFAARQVQLREALAGLEVQPLELP